MEKIIGVKFRNTAKVYYFAPGEEDFKKDDGVIVETVRGVEYGTVCIEPKEVDDDEIVQPLKTVIRKATESDEKRRAANEGKIAEALLRCGEKIKEHKLNMKLVDAEYTFDGSKIIFYFSAPGRVDFRDLVKDLAAIFRIRIELRQIGIRDEVRLLGGIAPCGRPCCCASCISDFKKVSIKMAKMQGLSLNPSKISGLCGRLMCCLAYENDYYKSVYKEMPRVGARVKTPDGEAVVVSLNMLTYDIKVKFEDKDGGFSYKDYKLNELSFKKSDVTEEKLTSEELEAEKELGDE